MEFCILLPTWERLWNLGRRKFILEFYWLFLTSLKPQIYFLIFHLFVSHGFTSALLLFSIDFIKKNIYNWSNIKQHVNIGAFNPLDKGVLMAWRFLEVTLTSNHTHHGAVSLTKHRLPQFRAFVLFPSAWNVLPSNIYIAHSFKPLLLECKLHMDRDFVLFTAVCLQNQGWCLVQWK